ncbi:MAG: hypothetical protein PHN71_04665, partial [Candidatus Cloacimonetes bacterium]|nr:hypothetical protein [Candidatus Cloacimonadota bacterium]
MGWQALFITNAEGLFSLAAPLPLPNGAAQTVDITKMTGKKIVRIYSNLKRAFLTGCPLGLQES